MINSDNNQPIQFTEILDRISDAFVALDKNWRYTYVNKKAGEIFGRDPEQLIGKHIWTEFPEGIGQPFHKAYETAMAEQQPISLVEYYPPYDKWFENHIYPSPEGLTIYFKDITERKKNEEAVLKIRKENEALINSTSDLLWSINIDYTLITANKAFINGLEANGGFLIKPGDNVLSEKYFPDEYVQYWKTLYNKGLSGEALLTEVFTPQENSSEFLWFELKIDPIIINNKINGIACLMRNITQRKKDEQILKENEEKYRVLSEASPDFIMQYDDQCRHTYMNKAALEISGFTAVQVIGKTHREAGYDATQSDNWEEKIKYVFNTGKTVQEQFEWEGANGRMHLDWRLSPELDINGKVISVLGVSRDITQLKNAEDELKIKENQLRLFIKYSPAALIMLDMEMKYIDVSRQFAQDYGLEINEMIGKSHYEVFPEIPEAWKKIHQQCLTGETKKRDQEIFVRADGRIEWIKWEVHPWYKTNNEIGGIIIFTELVTEFVKAKSLLEQTNKRYEVAEKQAKLGSWEFILDSKITTWSKQLFRLFGLKPAEFAPSSEEFVTLIHPDDIPIIEKSYSNALKGIVPESKMYRTNPDTVGFKYLYPTWEIEKDEAGNPVRLFGTTQDITERVLTEQKIKESEEKYRSLIKQASDGIAITDQQGNILEVNESYCKQLGYTAEELIGMTLWDIIPEKDHANQPPQIQKLLDGENLVYERKLKRKDGSVFFAEINSKMASNGNLIGFIRDITERKEKNEALGKSLQRNSAFLNTIPDLIFVINKDGYFVDFHNPQHKQTLSSSEDFLGKKLNEVLPPAVAEATLINVTAALSSSENIVHQYQLEYADGLHHFEARYAAMNNEEVFTIVRENTNEKQAELKIIESEGKYRTLVEQASDAIFIADESYNFLEVNSKACSMTGYTSEELNKLSIPKLAVIEDDDEPFKFKELKEGIAILTQRKIKAKDGTIIPVEISAQKMNNGNYLSFVRDITERKKNEEKILQLNKELEVKVKERTAELENANAGLQEVNDLFVGREARIIELKEELESLKNKRN